MGPLTLDLAGLTVHTHDVFVVLGAVVAAGVYVGEARRRGMGDSAHLAVAAGALLGGALLAKGATGWRYLLEVDDPSIYGLLAHGGKSILGGLAGAYAGAEVAKRLVGIRHSTGDLFAPAVPAGMLIGRLGCLLTEPPGTPTDLPWGVALSPAQAAQVPGCTDLCLLPSHPAHAYELLFHAVSLVVVLRLRDRMPKQGAMFTAWLLAYGTFRFLQEFVRPNPDVWWVLSGSQLFLLVTLPLLVASLRRLRTGGLLTPPDPADRLPDVSRTAEPAR